MTIAGKKIRCFFLISCWLCTAGLFTGFAVQQPGRIRLAGIFGDGMVVQRDMDVPVWGWGEPHEEITIGFAGRQVRCHADSEGKWFIRIPSGAAGGPYEMKITSAHDSVVLRDVLVGEVWIASGQSNMAFQLKNSIGGDSVARAAHYPDIRLFTVLKRTGIGPLEDIRPSMWKACTPEAAAPFSAVAYHFAEKLHTAQGLPVGIIHVSWGGTGAEAWTSAEKLLTLPGFRHKVLQLDTDTAHWSEAVNLSMKLDEQRARVVRTAGNGIETGVHLPDYEDKTWLSARLPLQMADIGKPGYWGFVWLRTNFTLPDMVPDDLQLQLPVRAERAEVYMNGEALQADAGKKNRYTLPSHSVRQGRNVIAIRMLTYRGTGTVGHTDSVQAGIVTGDKPFVALTQPWRYHTGIEPEVPPLQSYFNTPTVLFNALIHPLIPFGIKGVIWYQGESNAAEPEQYATLFPAMIGDWRERWGQGDFPFLFVQLAGMERIDPDNRQWAILREAQAKTAATVPATGLAVAIDVGEKDDIHPRNKADVGKRLSLLARGMVYHEPVMYAGPSYHSMKIAGSSIRLRFRNTGSGLAIKGTDPLNGFTIAGADGRFYPAEARIDREEVVVSSAQVKEPVAVRYAFGGWTGSYLSNSEGLPAAPFRTDQWDL